LGDRVGRRGLKQASLVRRVLTDIAKLQGV
jgi:hypothetical protein